MSDNLQEIAPAPADTRKDMLREQLEALDPAPALDTQELAAPNQADRARDDTGRFVKADLPSSAESAPEATSEAASTLDPAWKSPPKSWKKDVHPLWETADPKLKEYAWQREDEMARGVEPLKAKAQFADSINSVIEPYLPTIRSLGIDAPTAIKGLMQADYTLRNSSPTEKRTYFLGLAQRYGVNLDEPSQDGGAPADPVIGSLQNEIHSIKTTVQSWQQEQEAAAQRNTLDQINAFKGKVEFFEAARPEMIRLLAEKKATSLEDAYEKVTNSPESPLYELIQRSKQAVSQSTQREAADKAAKAARAAAVSVKGSTPGSQAPTKAQSRREMLAEQISNMDSRL